MAEGSLRAATFPFTKPSESVEGVRNVNHVVEGSPLPKIPGEVIENILYPGFVEGARDRVRLKARKGRETNERHPGRTDAE